MNTNSSLELYNQALTLIPGGVNSPVRAFKSVGTYPIFIKKAKGALLFDEDNNKYIDLLNSWGPMILGHAHPEVVAALAEAIQDSFTFGTATKKEVEIAELITSIVPSVEKIRMVNSGTEATMSAIRLARGYTKRSKIIKFRGCYHGHGDSFLIQAGSGALTFGKPDSDGVTEETAKNTLLADYNDIDSIKELFEANKGEIAAVIVEPVPANMGVILPQGTFLQELREICTNEETLLIFDEVMSGFRVDIAGAQNLYRITPDLSTFGKIIGGGLPVGAIGGKAEIMDFFAPSGSVYQAGTLSGNPLAMTAGFTTLKILNDNPNIYFDINEKAATIVNGIRESLKKHQLPYQVNMIGSMFTLFFTETSVTNFETAKTSDTEKFGAFFRFFLENGIHLPASQFEAIFVSKALESTHVEKIIDVADQFFGKI